MVDGLTIRKWTSDDNVSELTKLLHRSYKSLADMGLRFLATHQDDTVTLDRIMRGDCYLGCINDNLIATVTLYGPEQTRGTPWYDREDVAHFGQFGVEPELQRRGIGSLMMDHVEAAARVKKIPELALDTSENAVHLIDYYERRGYRFIEFTQWSDVNYQSVIMSKTL